MNNSLIKLDQAKALLAEVNSVQDAKEIVDTAQAAEIYAKKVLKSEEAEMYARAIKLEAQRKAGEFLKEEIQQGGDRRSKSSHTTLKLSDINVTRDQSSNWQKLADIPEDKFEEIKTGKKTIKEAKGEIKKEKREKDIQQQKEVIAKGVDLPEGKFETIVIDPPWNYGTKYSSEGRRVANPYPEMSTNDIADMEIPASDNCVMWLWTTHKFIQDAFYLLDHWGFDYKGILTWNKEKIGMGHWLRMQCEFCLLGVKGKPIWDATDVRDIISEPRREHSRKPEAFYEMVDRVCVGRKLDYFSRQERDGWTLFGNDIKYVAR